jgi:hypothetical protein
MSPEQGGYQEAKEPHQLNKEWALIKKEGSSPNRMGTPFW